MGRDSKIEWCHHTFNVWRGCTKVSEACRNCYAEVNMSVKLHGITWGPNGKRVVKAESGWNDPLRWNQEAMKVGERHRVFCNSLADVFEGPETMPADSLLPVRRARWRLLDLIHKTPWLDWLLLTKRPWNVAEEICQSARTVPGDDASQDELIFWATDWAIGKAVPDNVWIGTSVEDQKAADLRIPQLLAAPAKVRFLSCEPLLQRIKLPEAFLVPDFADDDPRCTKRWVICGGESGPHARPMHPDWVRSLREQCLDFDVPFHFKQWGEWQPTKYETGPLPPILTQGHSPTGHDWGDGVASYRVGKHKAGRSLDGRTWDELPKLAGAQS